MVSRKTKLYKHQVRALKFHLSRRRTGDWSEMGVGKTIVALARIVVLKNAGVVGKVLVVCPLSVLETWAIEIRKHTTLTFTRLEGSLDRKIRSLNENTDLFLISYDSIAGRKKTIGKLFTALKEKHFDLLVCDEVTHVKSKDAIRTKAIVALADSIRLTHFMSGYPITNRQDDILTIYRAMDGGKTFGRNFYASRNKWFRNVGFGFPKWEVRKESMSQFQKRLYADAIRIRKSDCLDLPPKIFTERFAYLNPPQVEVYVIVAKKLLEELSLPEGKVNLRHHLVNLGKLSQITSGFVYTDKLPYRFTSNPKIDLLRETLDGIADEKVVVFMRWREDIAMIEEFLRSVNRSYVSLHGNTKNRGEVIDKFVNGDVRTMVAQITSGAYSHTFTVAHHVIYYSFGFSVLEWAQSQDRIHRVGQTLPCIYIPFLVKGSIDEYIYETLRKGVDIASSLTDGAMVERLKLNLKEVLHE